MVIILQLQAILILVMKMDNFDELDSLDGSDVEAYP